MTTTTGSDITLSKLLPKVQAIDIEFQNFSYSVNDSDGPRKILRNLSGIFKSGEITAVLGPSGAGKTTLLNLLAGYAIHHENSHGSLLINGRPRHVKKFRKLCSYIMQEALVQPHLSVLESMLIVSRLKVAGLRDDERLLEIEGILTTLGIAECMDTYAEVLSGGQKKRFSIALELVSNPSVLFLDEPTTGLDIHAGKKVISALINLASQGRTIICTVHQPAPLEFKTYNHVYVIAKGACVYSGTPYQVVPFLQEAGTPCPTTYSPADYIIELVQMCPQVIELLANSVTAEQNQSKSNFNAGTSDSKPVRLKKIKAPSSCVKLKVLLGRMMLQRWRDKHSLFFQILNHVASGLLTGFTFYGVGQQASEIIQNIKFCMVICVFYMYTYAMVAILYFPLEVALVKRESFNNWYGSLTYYIAKSVSTIPMMISNVTIFTMLAYVLSDQPLELIRIGYILLMAYLSAFCAEGLGMFIGSLGSIKNGCILGPAILGPLFALSVYGIGYGDYIEPFMTFLMKISFMRFSLEGTWISVFGLHRAPLICKDSEIYCHWKDPSTILKDLGMRQSTEWAAFWGLFFYTILYRIFSYLAIKYRLDNNLPGSATSTAVFGFAGKVIGHFRKKRTIK